MPSFKIAPASANAWAALELRKMWPQLVQRNGSWMNVRLPRLHRPSKTTSKTHQSARQHTSSTLHACRRASEHICCAHARHANPRSHARTHAGTQKPHRRSDSRFRPGHNGVSLTPVSAHATKQAPPKASTPRLTTPMLQCRFQLQLQMTMPTRASASSCEHHLRSRRSHDSNMKRDANACQAVDQKKAVHPFFFCGEVGGIEKRRVQCKAHWSGRHAGRGAAREI